MHNIEKLLQMTYFWKNEYFIDRHVYFFVSKNIEKFVLLFQLLCDSAISDDLWVWIIHSVITISPIMTLP